MPLRRTGQFELLSEAKPGTAMQIRDRIKELRRVPAASFGPTHATGALIPSSNGTRCAASWPKSAMPAHCCSRAARRLAGIDRRSPAAETTPDAVVPVLVLDVDEAEAAQVAGHASIRSAGAGRNQRRGPCALLAESKPKARLWGKCSPIWQRARRGGRAVGAEVAGPRPGRRIVSNRDRVPGARRSSAASIRGITGRGLNCRLLNL